MSKTFEMIQKTLGEIENTSVKAVKKSKTADEVKRILLNLDSSTTVEETKTVVTETSVKKMEFATPKDIQLTEFCFDMDALGRYKDDCNRQFIIPYFRGILPSWKHFNKPVIFVKKIIRKLCRSLIEPMVELQNNFNAAVTNTLNALYNNEVVTQAFINQQMMVNNQLLVLMQEQEIVKCNAGDLACQISELFSKIDEVNQSIDELKVAFNNRFEMSEEKAELINDSIKNIDMQMQDFANREEMLKLLEKHKGNAANLANEIEQARESIQLLNKKTEKYIKTEDAMNLLEKQEAYAKDLADSVSRLDKGFQLLHAKTTEFMTIETVECLQEKQEKSIRSLAEKVEKAEENINLFNEKASEFLREEDAQKLIPKFASNDPLSGYTDIDYFDFETNFRGTQYSVKERLKDYIKYFPKTGTVIDLGCGRGEFLELLAENEFEGVGVDTYDDFVAYCVDKGLHVVKEDAVEYVSNLQEQSVAGIFAAQLVEHLPVNKLVDLCNETYKKLMPGGVAVFETPNPTNLSIYINGFYLDPTHQNPVHPKTLEYLLKKAGFKEIDIVYTEYSKAGYRLPMLNASGVENLKEFNDGINLLSDVFFGSQDYAVIARK